MGAHQWGEGMDENVFRLAENFAMPAKTTGMNLPEYLGGVSPNTDYDENIHPIAPQDQNDPGVGVGNGITVPVMGQNWFNKDNQVLYYWTGTAWKTSSGVFSSILVPPGVAAQGDLWYDLDVVTGCNAPVLKIYDPTHPEAQGNGWVRVTAESVGKCGDTMSGDLSMGGGSPPTMHKITDLADPTNDYDAANKLYVDTEVAAITGPGGVLTLHVADNTLHVTSNQNILLDAIEAEGCLNGAVNSALIAADLCDVLGYSTGSGALATDVNDRLSKSAGGTMTGNLTLNGPGHSNAPGLAATEDYVDAAVNAATGIGTANRVTRTYVGAYTHNTAVAAGALDGDIGVNTSSGFMFMARGGLWRQVFPALYS
jgi:hypothetical protein